MEKMKQITTDTIIEEYRSCLMGLSMVSIMLFHQKWIDGVFFDFFHRTGHLGVDMFLLLSGWGIYHSLQKNSIMDYFKNRFLRLIPTCILIGWLQIAFDYIGFDGIVDSFPQYALRIIGLFKWYVIAIVVYYSLAPWVSRVQRRGNNIILFIVISIAAMLLVHQSHYFDSGSYLITTIPYVFDRLPVFLLGMYIAQNPIPINKTTLTIGVFAYMVVLLIFYNVGHISIPDGLAYIVYLFSLPCILFALSRTILLMAFLKVPIQWIGKYTLELYLWHEFVYLAITNVWWSENCWLQLSVAVIVSFLLAFVSQYIWISIKKCRHW